jgi:hypothetical protein
LLRPILAKVLPRVICFGYVFLFLIDLVDRHRLGNSVLVITQRGAFGLIQSPISNAVMCTLPSEDRSMGSGLHGVHRGVAAAFGVALCSLISA